MLDIAVELALEVFGVRARSVAYAERESSAAAILLARMEESSLEPAPIWCGDLESFPSELFRGSVAGGIAGFPCPPVSVAGKGLGMDDERWILPAILDGFCAAGCEWVFLENVRGLLFANDGAAFGEVLRLLAERGFNEVEWTVLEAREVGASQERGRVFFVAHRNARRGDGCAISGIKTGKRKLTFQGRPMALSGRAGLSREERDATSSGPATELHSPSLADGERIRRREGRAESSGLERRYDAAEHGGTLEHTEGERCRKKGQHLCRGYPIRTAQPDQPLANSESERRTGKRPTESAGRECDIDADGQSAALDDSKRSERRPETVPGSDTGEREDAHGGNTGRIGESSGSDVFGFAGIFAPGPTDRLWSDVVARWPFLAPAVESCVRVLADGVAVVLDESRADQLRAGGNGVVALQGACAFVDLLRRFKR